MSLTESVDSEENEMTEQELLERLNDALAMYEQNNEKVILDVTMRFVPVNTDEPIVVYSWNGESFVGDEGGVIGR